MNLGPSGGCAGWDCLSTLLEIRDKFSFKVIQKLYMRYAIVTYQRNHISSSMISTKVSTTQSIFKYITDAHIHMNTWVCKCVGIESHALKGHKSHMQL